MWKDLRGSSAYPSHCPVRGEGTAQTAHFPDSTKADGPAILRWRYKFQSPSVRFRSTHLQVSAMSDALPRIVDYIEELRDEYSRQTFSNLLVEFLDEIIPGHSPENQKGNAVKDFVARFTNITISGTENRRIIYGFRILDAMIAILRSPIVGAIHFEHSEVERLSPLEEQLRWEIVENAISRFRRYWDVSHFKFLFSNLCVSTSWSNPTGTFWFEDKGQIQPRLSTPSNPLRIYQRPRQSWLHPARAVHPHVAGLRTQLLKSH